MSMTMQTWEANFVAMRDHLQLTWSNFWKAPPKDPLKAYLWYANAFLLKFPPYISVLLFLAMLIILVTAVHYYIHDCITRWNLRKRQIAFYRQMQRHQQERRPGAAYRNHEIFRRILRRVRHLIRQADLEYDAMQYHQILLRTARLMNTDSG